MTGEDRLPDFDAAYRGEPVTEGAPRRAPWTLGEPQPTIATLLAEGEVRSPVLDAGCGTGDTAIDLVERGHEVVGVDAVPSAIAEARDAAARRGVSAEFVIADITTLTGYDERFATVIDSALLHSLPVEKRDAYLAAIARAAAPGAVLYALVFERSAPFPPDFGPNAVDADELREVVSPYWTVDRIEPSTITMWPIVGIGDDWPLDEHGRSRFPALLLRAHRP